MQIQTVEKEIVEGQARIPINIVWLRGFFADLRYFLAHHEDRLATKGETDG